MTRSCTPVSDWMLAPFQPHLQSTCFLVGCLEREQWLNIEGLYAYWIRATTAWLSRSALGTGRLGEVAASPRSANEHRLLPGPSQRVNL
jgi:hypothetical protein